MFESNNGKYQSLLLFLSKTKTMFSNTNKKLPTIICLLLAVASNLIAQTSDSNKTVVLGWVLDGNSKTMLANAQVILTDLSTNTLDTLVTKEDGTYSFNIVADNDYAIYAQKGDLISETSQFKTSNLTDPIEYINLWTKQQGLPGLDMVSLGDTPRKTNTLLSNPITYSVQLGLFTVKPSMHSQYLEKVKDDVIFEPLPNEDGYMAIIGKFTDYSKAERYYLKMIDFGYIDSKIVAFWGDKCLNISAPKVKVYADNH